ncbi:MAG: rod shape-determining protein MreC [Dokdonella sp.]|uniref:rod shape-determining protein MreC n=1 Tax=Dokdonella sp. TaxID=2291710 RepID=UPI002B72CB7C|nr:rod shape-determining protein MreC [Dokdonella sp.]HOX71282.1 rod shape-determining protein MreC [Dokdonella sp.]HPN78695.1 rod shape-determining protein MreC [Dokdonella sp.]
MPLASPDKVSLFAEGAVSTLRLIAYLTMAMIIMVIDHRGGYLIGLRNAASAIVEPAYRVAAMPSEVAKAGRLAIATQSHLVDENRNLREALLLAQARLNRMSALVAQNDRLKKLLDVQKDLGLGVQLARLIDIDLDPFRHRVVLDAGSQQSIVVGQPVLDAHGVMGQIVEVLPNTSVAMLVTDPTHAIPVMVERTGLRTIAYGTGSIDRLQLPNVPISADVKVGDLLVTSGLGGRFPAGFPVGEILDVSNDESGMFAAAIARPAAALDRSGEVLLLQDLPQPMGPPAPTPVQSEATGLPAASDPPGSGNRP